MRVGFVCMNDGRQYVFFTELVLEKLNAIPKESILFFLCGHFEKFGTCTENKRYEIDRVRAYFAFQM